MKFQSQFGSERTGIQLAPMIDIVFLLLIFFIVLWNYARFETEIDISVPAASSGENPQRTIGEIVVNVRKSGEIVVEGLSKTDPELLYRKYQTLIMLGRKKEAIACYELAFDSEPIDFSSRDWTKYVYYLGLGVFFAICFGIRHAL